MNLSVENKIKNKIEEFIGNLSQHGKTDDGGITRLVYSKTWTDAQNLLVNKSKEIGFDSNYDEVGNLFIRLNGTKFKNETILTGSHIDTVVNGGKLDGQLGIVGGILAMEYLQETYGEPLRNIETVSFAEEEGSRFPFTCWGSKNIIRNIPKEEVTNLKDQDGISLDEAMRGAGFKFKSKESVRTDIKTFIELHIEQGGVLESEEKEIGVVNYIAGQKRFIVNVQGVSNHAGTTPMELRKDALHGASKMIINIMELAKEYGDALVATVGQIEVSPNTSNVIPGKVKFTMEVRHIKNSVLMKFAEEMSKNIKNIGQEMDLKVDIENHQNFDPVPMDKDLVSMIKNQCEETGVNYKLLASGAGHDSQILAPYIPTAMIFVPSHKGISHSPLEFTETEDLLKGIKVLIDILYKLAY